MCVMNSFKGGFSLDVISMLGGKLMNWIDVIETEWTQTPADMEIITIFKRTHNSIIIVSWIQSPLC